MERSEPFAVIGGDQRMEYLARFLSREHPILRWHKEQSFAALEDVVALGKHLLFPMPFSRDGIHLSGAEKSECTIDRLLPLLGHGHKTLFGGQLPASIRKECEALGISCCDWMEMEDVSLPNAVLTAEGAIGEAILHTNRTLGASKCLILGWGRCAQALARKLRYLVNDITVAARNPYQRLSAKCEGFSVLPPELLYEHLPEYDLLFNTIPTIILPGKLARRLSQHCVLLDLASGPLTAHIALQDFSGLAVSCPGLPGKYFSRDAGEILAKAALSRICTSG